MVKKGNDKHVAKEIQHLASSSKHEVYEDSNSLSLVAGEGMFF
jgi:hypothetical protein